MPLTNATTDFQAFVNDVFQNTLNRNFSYVFGQYPHFFLNPMMTTYSMYSSASFCTPYLLNLKSANSMLHQYIS